MCSFMIRIWLLFKMFWPHCGKVEFCPNTTNAGRRCPPASPWCLCHVSDCFFPLLAAAFAMPGTLYLAIYSDLISCLCRWYYAPCSDVWRWPMTNRFVKRQLKVSFFQKVRFVFQISKSQTKNIPKNCPDLKIKISSSG